MHYAILGNLFSCHLSKPFLMPPFKPLFHAILQNPSVSIFTFTLMWEFRIWIRCTKKGSLASAITSEAAVNYFVLSIRTVNCNRMALAPERAEWSSYVIVCFHSDSIAKANDETRLLLVVRKKQTICFDWRLCAVERHRVMSSCIGRTMVWAGGCQ